jgi:hypothetical protein
MQETFLHPWCLEGFWKEFRQTMKVIEERRVVFRSKG